MEIGNYDNLPEVKRQFVCKKCGQEIIVSVISKFFSHYADRNIIAGRR
jgi:hypothetical protein